LARVIKGHDERYEEFLDVSQSLFFSKGYDQTSVQDIIDRVGVAKGTFYHYFRTKVDLLDAVTKRLRDLNVQRLQSILDDASLRGREKLERFFDHLMTWKAGNREFFLQIMHVLYHDDNVLLRNRLMSDVIDSFAPLLGQAMEQGIDEGDFTVDYPLETAQMVLAMTFSLSDAIAAHLMEGRPFAAVREVIARKLMAYNRNLERLLGVETHGLTILDVPRIAIWFDE
jgi:AcrR family transcriptional regulator